MGRRSRWGLATVGWLATGMLLVGQMWGSVAGAAEAKTTYTTIMSEGFEGFFPTGLWSTFDANGATGGEYYWDDTWCAGLPGGGHTWCAWPARGGHEGFNPQFPDHDY